MTNNKNKKRILLVDDEPDIALAFKIGLEDNGFKVDMFNDPQEASLNFKRSLYDLLLLDIKMPNMNGIEFYYQMKEIDTKVKICFITASEIYYFKQITEEIFNLLGTKCLLRKPIKLVDLVNVLKKELDYL
jgi:two-component system catabolic regulation response regulator CreB/two-component system response regulator ChvI